MLCITGLILHHFFELHGSELLTTLDPFWWCMAVSSGSFLRDKASALVFKLAFRYIILKSYSTNKASLPFSGWRAILMVHDQPQLEWTAQQVMSELLHSVHQCQTLSDSLDGTVVGFRFGYHPTNISNYIAILLQSEHLTQLRFNPFVAQSE